VFANRGLMEGFFRNPIGKKYLCFYAVMVLGIPFALYSRAAFNFTIFKYTVNLLFFALFLVHVRSFERMKSMVLTIVCAACFYGASSIMLGGFEEGRFSFGSMYDPNDLSYILVSLVPFTALYLKGGERLLLKALGVATMLISMLVILYTGSRGGFIGLLLLVGLFIFSRMSPVRRSMKVAFLVCILVFAASKHDMIFSERYATILNLKLDYNISAEEGRLNIWKRGLEITFSNPLTGVGAMCFPEAIAMDRRNRYIAERWQAAHNAFIQISSELGLFAFALFALMIKDTFRIFRKVRRAGLGPVPGPDLKRLAGIAQIGFTAHLIVAFFLTQGYSILFTLFFAFAAAMNRALADPAYASPDTVPERGFT